jgi:YVTN family beta-propeller protein
MRLIKIVILILLVFGCKKKKVVETNTDNVTPLKNGMIVLCEGLFQQNNASLSWIDLSTSAIDNQFFTTKTGRFLGDTGNDMESYGGKIYVVVNVSSTIEVLDKSTGTSIKQISMMNNGISKQPRSIAFYGSNAFVSCFDGYVDVIDTSSLEVVKRIKVGLNPEGLTVSNSKLYVSNSGGLNSPKMDSTVSVIDLTNLIEYKKIKVGQNPGSILTDLEGDVYVIARGNYSSIASKMVKINTTNDDVAAIFSEEISGIEKMESNLLITYKSSSNSVSKVGVFDVVNEVISVPELINGANFTTLYGLQYRSSNQKIYCLDAMNYTNTGYVKVFSKSGSLENSYHVGLNPSKIIFYE